MKKYTALVLALLCVLSLAGCASKSDETAFSEHKSFELENVSKLILISVDGKRFEVNDTDTIRQITENIESIRFEKGESSENTNGFGPFIQWYDTNDNLIEVISVMGEQTIIHDGFFWTATDGNIDAELLERVFTEVSEETEISDDENGLSGTALYEITPGQIEIVPSLFEELDVDYATNDDGIYTYNDIIYRYKIEVSGFEGESQVTFIVLTNNTEISFEDISYSLKKAEISTGVPEFIILGWY